MADLKQESRDLIAFALNEFKKIKNIETADIDSASVTAETPPKPEMGDVGFPMFAFAKQFRMAPPVIASEVLKILDANPEKTGSVGEFFTVGPYVNVKLKKENVAGKILENICSQKEEYGTLNEAGQKYLQNLRVMIEFSSPNTNKPLHLGHLRNDALGESVSRILKAAGADVFKVNIINNRGVHICKSMLAYKLFHEANGDTPEKLGMKGDHFVGQCYVEFDKYLKGEKDKPETAHPEAAKQAEEMLVKWEAGDPEVHKLWKTMNGWTFDGIRVTYNRTGVSFDKFYYESDTYLLGKEIIAKGLEKGLFFKAEDGSVCVDVTEAVGKSKEGGNQLKVLLRKDGTSVYITQDIGTAVSRHNDWDFNQMVYVVGSEQQYHFKVLFYILKKLGYSWAEKLFHLSYGMVNLPEGRMKSREGTVVDADDLIDKLRDDVLEEITAKGRESAVGDSAAVAEKIALGALHYFLLQATPTKDMLFNPKESLSFNGNTGPYLQYMGARICSILRKAEETGTQILDKADLSLLTNPLEWELIKLLGDYPEAVHRAAEKLDPSEITAVLYGIAKAFSSFYHDCSILGIEDKELLQARLKLVSCVKTVLKNGMELVLIPFMETM
ncbi:MAG: arginine--tRNA ligase [Spirochaetaceae bacterium]|nr:arginine--tRNA ligase [Spirochaetaceae bacterium]